MATRICTRCSAQTQPARLDSAAGESAPVALTVRDMPLLACPSGHRQFVRPDFAFKAVERLLAAGEAKLPAGREKGFLRTRYLCGECGAELGREPARRETFPLEVAPPGFDAFRVELSAPVYRCPACSREQLRSLEDMRKHAPPALAQAFRAADIPPA